MLAALRFGGKQNLTPFTPPPFESTAVQGVPHVPENLGYLSPYREGMGYRFSVCGNIILHGTDATVFFTNPAGNDVWLKLRVLDESGNLLGETGLIRPGEYVQTVALNTHLEAGIPIRLKIMGYTPETYHSAGSVMLNTAVGTE